MLRPYARPTGIEVSREPVQLDSGPAAYVSQPSYLSAAQRARFAPAGRGSPLGPGLLGVSGNTACRQLGE